MKRDFTIVGRAFRTFFAASVVSSIVLQLNILIDGLIVSNAIGPDAISSVNLVLPVSELLLLGSSFLYYGAGLLGAKEIGAQNFTGVRRLFTLSLLAATALAVLFATTAAVFAGPLAHLLTDEERLAPLVAQYLPFSAFTAVAYAIQFSFTQFLKIGGRAKLVIIALIAGLVANALMDVLFVIVFKWGMNGAAMATFFGILCSVLAVLPVALRDRNVFRLENPFAKWFPSAAGESFCRGIPPAADMGVMSVQALLINEIVLKAQGADGLFVISIYMQLEMFFSLFLEGSDDALTGIGGELLGERDLRGFRMLVKNVLRLIVIGLAAVTVLILIEPTPLAYLFGADERLAAYTAMPLRQLCLLFVPMGIVMILAVVYNLQERTALAALLEVGMLVFLIPPAWAAAIWAPEWIWLVIGLGLWGLVLVGGVIVYAIARRDRSLAWPTLIPSVATVPTLDGSVNASPEAVREAFAEIESFLSAAGIDDSRVLLPIRSALEAQAAKGVRGVLFDYCVAAPGNGDRIAVVFKSVVADFPVPDDPRCETVCRMMNGIRCLYMLCALQ